MSESENTEQIETIEKLSIQLGDIIEIVAPSDPAMDNHTFFIKFLDNSKIVLLEGNGNEYTLTLKDNGNLDNESIIGINILSRAESSSYARQNNLTPGKWIDIYFGGDVPTIITGEITNLEEDMIEITTYPEKDVIFIDFNYKGIPEDIPIIKINLRNKPEGSEEISETEEVAGIDETDILVSEENSGEQIQFGEVIDESNVIDKEKKETTPKVSQYIRDIFLTADQIQFGEELDEISQVIDIADSEKRYSLEKQTTDLLDELLSTIPNIKRTDAVLNNIHIIIQRFKQLRKKFSIFDKDGNLIKAKINGANYKPLIETLHNFNHKLYWILPVVKNIKKIYDYDDSGEEIDNYPDIMSTTLAESRNGEDDILGQYNSGNMPDQDNKYAFLLKNINKYLTPFENDNDMDDSSILAKIKVNSSLATIVDNLGDFYSSVMSNSKDSMQISRRRFVIQTYNLGLQGLEMQKFRGGETTIERKNITENDTLHLKSLLFLPEVTVRFARVNLPYTSIMMKANLNDHFLNYWQLLKNKTNVHTTTIQNIDEPIDYNSETFLKHVKDIKLDEGLFTDNVKDNDIYNKYLDSVIPKTRFLFNLIKPYIDDNLTLHDVIEYLEPFMIYQDDMSFMQYQEINDFIAEKIQEHKKNYLLKTREYNLLKTNINSFRPRLLALFDENIALKENIISAYGLNDEKILNMTSEEFLNKIRSIDSGRLYNTSIAMIGTNLMIANGLKDINTIGEHIKKDNFIAKTTQENQCKTYRTISKRYIELDELQEDDGKDIYFDKKYDTTYYDLLADYGKPEPNMTNDSYIGFLVNSLMKKIGLSETDARREARAMLEGKRAIEDGDYAILENIDGLDGIGASVQYFRRQNKTWVVDESISDDVFDDKLKMICNLNENCLDVKDNCDTIENSGNQLKDENLKLVLKEFDEGLSINKALVTKTINDELADAMKRIVTLLDLVHTQTYKSNYKQYDLGMSVESVDTVASPFTKLRDTILGQTDYVKRQQDILKFVKYFTREPLELEKQYWLYCIKTSTPLLPTFLENIASSYISREDVEYTIEKICKEQGKISEDGDSWVDEHSGYIIRKIALNTDEEFTEEGFKNITRSVLEADLGDSIMQIKQSQKQIIDPESEKITNIINIIARSMGINVDAYKDFIIRNVRKLQDSRMLNETEYNKKLEFAAAKGKKNLDDYQTAYNQFLIYSTLSYMLISIQTAIPSIRTRKTHPGCVRSFSGFPIGGSEDMTGITYIACIVNKIKSPIEHWKSIQKMSASTISKRIETQLSMYILQNEDVQELIKTKETYLLLNKDETIPDEHNITNMEYFLPPLVNIKLPSLQNVSSEFNKKLISSFRKGSLDQFNMLNIMRTKVTQFSFGIIELIQKTVYKKAAIMTNNSGEPFLENACCGESENINTLNYFIKANPEIAQYNDIITDLNNTLHHTLRMGKAGIYYDPRDTKNIIPPLPIEFSEETIYKAFIVLCKYGSNVPIKDELKAVCMNKPEVFDNKSSLAEQIRKLKGEGRNYSIESLQKLLTIVNKNNTVDTQRKSLSFNMAQSLKDILASLDFRNVINIPTAFTEKFQNVLDNFEINGLAEDTPEMRTFQNYLATVNDSMSVNIISFIKTSTSIKKRDFKFFKECIDSITDFQETGDNMVLESQDETIFKMMSFIKNSLRCLTRELPNIIINSVDNANVQIPKHWGLSERHTADIHEIINTYYVSLNEFYGDEDILLVLKKFMNITKDTEMLAKLTEFYAPIKMNGDKYIYSTMERRLVVRLFKYYFYSTLTDLISLKDDDEVLIRKMPKQGDDMKGDESELMSSDNAFSLQNGEVTELEIISGEKKQISNKIARLLYAFVEVICNDKKIINYNYKTMMDKVLRSKEKEKDDITGRLKNMTDEERDVENIFKKQKLERWGKGLEKGLVNYQKKTYDEEREAMEKQMLMDARMSKNKDISDMNKEMYKFDMLAEEQLDDEIDDEATRIDYMGEDADYEEMGMDGDEIYD